ncbi:MAG: GNAT family N-acetyltransferase [Lentisphaerae bacterium]|nr:GNAT family N-acetyltransferase [Lentisphaerota bacterium]
MTVEITTITTPDELERLLPEWRAFVSEPEVSGGVWCDPLTVGSSVRFEEGEGLLLAKVSEGSECCMAFAPFLVRSRRVPLSVGLWSVGGCRARVARLCDSDFATRTGADRAALLLEILAGVRDAAHCDIIEIPNCPVIPGWSKKARESGGLSGLMLRNVQDTFLVNVRGDFPAYLSGLSSNTRQMLGRKLRRMERESGSGVTIRCFRRVEEMDELRTHLVAVWNESWHGRLGRYEPPPVDFLVRLAEQGWIRSYILFAGDERAASVLGLQYKGKFLDEAPAHGEKWRRFSPGMVLNYLALKDLFEHDSPSVIDFGFGYNQYKETLGTDRETRGEYWLPASARGRAITASRRVCDGVFRVGKALLSGTPAVRKWKERLRRGKRA